MKRLDFAGERVDANRLPDHLSNRTSAPADFDYNPHDEPLKIIHQDEGFLVLSKPAGLLSVEGKAAEHKDCLESRAKTAHPMAKLVHRLDMDTSGLILVSLDRASHRHLGLQFERRKVSKSYIARVSGHPDQDEGRIDLPLICDWPNRPKQMVSHEIGKQAITDWQVLEREEGGYSRMLLSPLTGRAHQLRVHMFELGHPILGDRLYGNRDSFKATPRLQLHAQSLTIHHPADGRLVSFSDPAPF